MSAKCSPSLWLSLRLGSIGSPAGLQPKKPVSSNKERVYFLWERYIPVEDFAISSPRKYFSGPRSLSLNMDCRELLTVSSMVASGLASMMSSTYASKMTKVFPDPL